MSRYSYPLVVMKLLVKMHNVRNLDRWTYTILKQLDDFGALCSLLTLTPRQNHRCIWHRLTAICDASFDMGL